MRAHEETWRLAREGSRSMLAGVDAYPAADFYGPEGDARIALAVQAPAMARLLLEVMSGWAGHNGGGPTCPVCNAEEPGPHTPDCRLVAALRAAGVIE